MSKTDGAILRIEGPAGALPIMKSDRLARQMAMLFECKCLGKPVEATVEKYGYSRQRYFQIVKSFSAGGTAALVPKRTGPKGNHVRTQDVVTQIIRHKFLDPDASEEVITQKLRQSGVAISTRSVQRTTAEYGLQKKTLRLSARQGSASGDRDA